MNRKQLTLILVAVVVLGGLGLWLRSRNTASYKTTTGRMGEKVLGEFDLNAVGQVVLRQGTNELTLARANEIWTVKQRGGYPANFSEVGEFLRKLWDLKVAQPVVVGPSQLPRLELVPEGEKPATVVELKDAEGKLLRTVTLGKKHTRQSGSPSPLGDDEGWPDGRYLMVDHKPETVSLVGEAFSNIEPKPEQWLNKDFFKVEKVKSVAVTYPNQPTNSWKLTRETETGELQLTDARPEEKLDASKVSGIPNALSWPSFSDVVVEPKADETGLDQPTVAVLETFDQFTYTVKVGKKKGEDAYYMALSVSGDFPKERTPGQEEKPEDKEKLDKEFKEKTDKLIEKLKKEKALEAWTFLASKWTFDSLLKERHALFAEKKDEAKNNAQEPDGGDDVADDLVPSLTPATPPPPPPPAPKPE